MPRTLPAAVLAQFAAGKIKPILLVQITFLSGTAYLWTGYGNLSWNGQTWLGTGTIGTISPIIEGNQTQAYGITLGLNALDSGLIAGALTDCRQGLSCIVWLGFLTDSMAVIADPTEAWRGRMDVPSIHEDPADPRISLTVEQRLIALKTAEPRRYTDQDQKLVTASDRGFEFVPQLQQKNLVWGKASGALGSSGSSSGISRIIPPRTN